MATFTASAVLEEFESHADHVFNSQRVVHPNIYLACWYLLTVAEDQQRLTFTHLGDQMEDWRVEYVLDRSKFALRHCLLAATQKATDKSRMRLPGKVVPMLYERASEALETGAQYSVAAQLCASTHAGGATVSKVDGVFTFDRLNTRADAQYGALELMRQSAGDSEFPFSSVLWYWIRHPKECPIVVQQIAASTRLTSRQIRYEFSPSLCIGLAMCLPQASFLIPDAWTFPWGGRHETTLLINSLCLRVMYHMCAVHFGATSRGLRGGAEGDLLPCLPLDEWERDVEENCSLDPVKVKIFLEYLTYGHDVQSPDQALQPLIPLGERFAIPGISLLSSNIERNLLTLQARVEPDRFNTQSHLFEQEMTSKLRQAFEPHWPLIASNQTFRLGNSREELDVLLCDIDSKTVLILELRWMLPPADPREIQTRRRVCIEKVHQVARKASSARAHLQTLLQVAFGVDISNNASAWAVHAAVVIEGFGGTASTDPNIPVVPEWVLEAGARATPSLRQLALWLSSSQWLPVNERDFELREQPPDLLGMNIRAGGIVPLRPGRDYLEDAVRTLFRNEVDDRLADA